MGEAIKTVGDLAGICGHDGTNWEKVLIDASKRLVVAIASIVASDVQLHGYDGAAWQKLGFVWNYNDTVVESVDDTNLDVGTNNLSGTVVPAGKVYVVTTASLRYEGAVCQRAYLGTVIDGTVSYFMTQLTPTTLVWYATTCNLILAAGDYMYATLTNCAAGDIGRMRYTGYLMDLDM